VRPVPRHAVTGPHGGTVACSNSHAFGPLQRQATSLRRLEKKQLLHYVKVVHGGELLCVLRGYLWHSHLIPSATERGVPRQGLTMRGVSHPRRVHRPILGLFHVPVPAVLWSLRHERPSWNSSSCAAGVRGCCALGDVPEVPRRRHLPPSTQVCMPHVSRCVAACSDGLSLGSALLLCAALRAHVSAHAAFANRQRPHRRPSARTRCKTAQIGRDLASAPAHRGRM
jgi:hypothetical protein